VDNGQTKVLNLVKQTARTDIGKFKTTIKVVRVEREYGILKQDSGYNKGNSQGKLRIKNLNQDMKQNSQFRLTVTKINLDSNHIPQIRDRKETKMDKVLKVVKVNNQDRKVKATNLIKVFNQARLLNKAKVYSQDNQGNRVSHLNLDSQGNLVSLLNLVKVSLVIKERKQDSGISKMEVKATNLAKILNKVKVHSQDIQDNHLNPDSLVNLTSLLSPVKTSLVIKDRKLDK